MSDERRDRPRPEPGTPDDPAGADDVPEPALRRHAVSLAAIGALGIWKIYEALVAPTMQTAIAPSLYTMGLAGFAVSILGPKSLRLATFLGGAALCVAAIALAARV